MQSLLTSMGGMQNTTSTEQNFGALQPDPTNSMPAPVQINTVEDPMKPVVEGEETKVDESGKSTALAH
jgi:hypothetical protein